MRLEVGAAVAAAVPLVVLGLLVVWRRWPLTRAAWVAAAIALVLAVTVGQLDAVGAFVGLGKGAWTGLWILAIVVPSLLLFQVVQRAGAIDHLSDQLGSLAGSRARQLLLLAWVLPAFVQGVAGFGLPLVMTAPLLVRAGFKPVAAVGAVMVGYHWSVTFGSMGSSYFVAAGTSGVDDATAGRFALYAAILLAVNALVAGALLLRRADEGRRSALLPMVVTGLVMAGTLIAVANIEPALGSTAAGLAGMAVLVLWYRRSAATVHAPTLLRAASPYVGLTAVALVGMLAPPFTWLAQRLPDLAPSFPATSSALIDTPPVVAHQPLELLGHPALYLLIACAGSWWYFRHTGWLARTDRSAVLSAWSKRATTTTVSMLGLTVLAALMVEAGLMAALAESIVDVLGVAFVPVSPVLGAIGTALTGNTTASNALLAPLQAAAANGIGMDEAVLLTGQTFGGNVGNVLTPINIAIAAVAVGAAGRESEILRNVGKDGVLLVALAAVGVTVLAALT